jgi:hypothetical protein
VIVGVWRSSPKRGWEIFPILPNTPNDLASLCDNNLLRGILMEASILKKEALSSKHAVIEPCWGRNIIAQFEENLQKASNTLGTLTL